MSVDQRPPDLEAQVQLDAYAPRFARHCVDQVDSPSPDLRDAVELLTSEVVTRAVQLYAPGRTVTLRIWMPSDVVRVELEVGRDYSLRASGSTGDYPLVLLDGLADRWSIDPARERATVWFEIDRHPPVDGPNEDAAGRAAPPDRRVRAQHPAASRARGGHRRAGASAAV
ncbi:MAG TPA: hypothetical protein VH025_11490 [Solirubrobacteraceae bacterium]|jgi:hypothetical protein|nr:hypothetical protein [Solirubrobacteraceae bacterium]